MPMLFDMHNMEGVAQGKSCHYTETPSSIQAGAVNALDTVTLRALAEAVLNGAASSQQDGQAAELARSILHQPNAVTNALVNQLAQLQVQQNQQLNLQQQV